MGSEMCIRDSHQAANSLVRQQCFIYREVGQIRLDSGALLGIEWLPRLDRVEGRRRVAGIVGERIWRQTRWQVISHDSTLRSAAHIAPAVRRHVHEGVGNAVCGT